VSLFYKSKPYRIVAGDAKSGTLSARFRRNDRHIGKSLFADQPVPPLVPARDEHREFL